MAVPHAKVAKKAATRTGSNSQCSLRQGDPHHGGAHQDVRRRRPVDLPAGDEELLVDRPEQEEVEVAGPDQLGEVVAVLEEQHLDQAVEREEAADEEEILVLRPAGEGLRLAEDRLVEGQHDPEPDHLDGDLDQEIAPERQLAGQGVAGEAAEESEAFRDHLAWPDQPP